MFIRGWLASLTSKKRTSPTEERYLYLTKNIRLFLEKQGSHNVYLHAIHFYLNADTLNAIQQAKDKTQSLYIPKNFLSTLRFYLFFAERNSLTLGLNVLSYYEQDQDIKPLLRSLIYLDGDIFYQIDRNCLDNSEFAQKLTIAHYWLINQLLTALKLNWTSWLNQLAWILDFIIIILYNVRTLQLHGWQILPILVSLALSWLGKQLLYWILQQLFSLLRRWILRQILFGRWAKQYQLQQRILNWLSRLGI